MRDRRDFLISTGLVLGSAAFLESSREAHAYAEEQQPLITLPSNQDSRTSNTDANGDIKTVIITGSNSGIGRASALQLASTGKFRVILACRTRAKADEAARELQKELSSSAADATKLSPSSLSPSPFIPMECDLSSFKSIRAFVDNFHKLGLPLDALALNAGVQFSGSEIIQRSTDGYELTIATNHLGHFLLANLLLPDLEASSSSSSSSSIANGKKGAPRIVVTASEVHDPASPGGSVGKGAHLGPSQFPGLDPSIESPMVDGGDWDADKAYKDSKLANVLFASELSRRLKASGSSVTVNSFGPGLITRTGFFRSQNPLFVGLFDFATNEIFKVAETVQGGGACLSFMISSPTLEGKSGLYFNNGISGYGGHSFVESGTSEESNDRKEAEALFEASKIAVGLA